MISYGLALISFILLLALVRSLMSMTRPDKMTGLIIAMSVVIHLGAAAVVGWSKDLNYWHFAAAYWFLVVCFVYAFGICYRSLSIQMLVELSQAPDHTEDVEHLFSHYFTPVVQDRVEALLAGKRAERIGNTLRLTEKGRRDVAIIQYGRHVLGMSGNRLYFDSRRSDT